MTVQFSKSILGKAYLSFYPKRPGEQQECGQDSKAGRPTGPVQRTHPNKPLSGKLWSSCSVCLPPPWTSLPARDFPAASPTKARAARHATVSTPAAASTEQALHNGVLTKEHQTGQRGGVHSSSTAHENFTVVVSFCVKSVDFAAIFK